MKKDKSCSISIKFRINTDKTNTLIKWIDTFILSTNEYQGVQNAVMIAAAIKAVQK